MLRHNICMSYFQLVSAFPGPCCQKAGYTTQFLKSSSPDSIRLTNGIALEMFHYYKSTLGEDYQKGIRLILRLSGIQQTITPKLLNTARTYLNRLHLRKQTLRASKLDSFLQETFKKFPVSQPPPAVWSSPPSTSPSPSLSVSNTSSASTTTLYVLICNWLCSLSISLLLCSCNNFAISGYNYSISIKQKSTSTLFLHHPRDM